MCSNRSNIFLFSIFLLLTMLYLSACRDEGDVSFNANEEDKLLYHTYAGQFETLWKGVNTRYVFWSDDTTDWDEIYTSLHPQFEELDEAYKQTGQLDTETFDSLYTVMFSPLLDHHLVAVIRDLHNPSFRVVVSPAVIDRAARDYTNGVTYSDSLILNDLLEREQAGQAVVGKVGEYDGQTNVFALFTLHDGKRVAYLWQSGFVMNEAIKAADEILQYDSSALVSSKDSLTLVYADNIRQFFSVATQDPDLGGVILDNRDNRGGSVADLKLVAGSFAQEPVPFCDYRYKDGQGRLEYTPWFNEMVDTTHLLGHRDLEAEGIPYIVLTNACSVSLAEISAAVIGQFSNARIVGERTTGGTGEIISLSSLLYDGSFGSLEGNHYVYMSSAQVRLAGQHGLIEGVGVLPDLISLTKDVGYKGQLDKALEIVNN